LLGGFDLDPRATKENFVERTRRVVVKEALVNVTDGETEELYARSKGLMLAPLELRESETAKWIESTP